MIETQDELEAKLAILQPESDQQRNDIACALIGHSNIIETCIGYVHCARCGAQIGDSLGGVYSNENAVIVGHNCETCRENYRTLTWQDKLFCPDPLSAIPVDA